MPPAIQRLAALAGLALLAPFLAGLAVAVRLSSPGRVLHRAVRVRPGGTFTLYKFRTMDQGATGAGPAVTVAGDPRITRVGRVLRRTKLDELPQLWNVVRGDMLLVGPRPEDPRYVDLDNPLHRLVFSAAPGITGPTAIAFRDEEMLLARAAARIARADGREQPDARDIDRAYLDLILPEKLRLDAEYLSTRSAWGDLALIGRTIGRVLGRTTAG